jgi:MFS family permease
MALLFLLGICVVSAFSILNSLVQEAAPDILRGRIVSIYGLAFRGGMPVGSLVAGFLVKPLGAPPVIAAFSLLLAVLAGVVYLRNGRIRSL